MPPSTRKVASKETLEESIKEGVEVTNPTIPIHADTLCFIAKYIKVTWDSIKDTFMKKRFVKDLKDMQTYINIKRSRIHKIA